MRPPRAVFPDSHFAVLAPSSPSERPRIEAAANRLRSRGARVTLAANIDSRGPRNYLAGSDEQRLEEFNRFLRSDDYDAFLFARGGYGSMRILDGLDYAALAANPRPIIGFSDITAIHQAVARRAGIASFHGPMLNLDFFEGLSPEREDWFWRLLRGDAPLTWRFDSPTVVTHGTAEGVLFGGCLSLTMALIGTPYDYWVDDGIWFWEDVDEPLYRIDRMLTHVRLSGRLRNIRGVIVGRLKNCGEEAELDALLLECFGGNGIPIIRDFPFGHHGNNLLMPVGVPVHLSTRTLTFTINAPAVERR
ncbi:MAG TPA: LD-carboxypeptidase [Thermoanaerobaculia bacterium]|nr:LD-carboxypeptidase [Thermoanaerobaculia bacterium]